MTHDVLSAREQKVGDELPPFELNVTSTVVVAGAIASRDFMPAHHDPDFAKAQGAPDIFMNILTTNGYVARYVTDWAGPEAMLKRIEIRLGAPAIPGKPLRFSGRVAQKSEAAASACASSWPVRAAGERPRRLITRRGTRGGRHVGVALGLARPRRPAERHARGAERRADAVHPLPRAGRVRRGRAPQDRIRRRVQAGIQRAPDPRALLAGLPRGARVRRPRGRAGHAARLRAVRRLPELGRPRRGVPERGGAASPSRSRRRPSTTRRPACTSTPAWCSRAPGRASATTTSCSRGTSAGSRR
jgi:acyl dehydratase